MGDIWLLTFVALSFIVHVATRFRWSTLEPQTVRARRIKSEPDWDGYNHYLVGVDDIEKRRRLRARACRIQAWIAHDRSGGDEGYLREYPYVLREEPPLPVGVRIRIR
jgi:hypothetical protein